MTTTKAATATKATATPWRVAPKRGGDYGMGERYEIQDANGNELFIVWNEELASQIVRAVNRDAAFDAMVEALRSVGTKYETEENGEPVTVRCWCRTWAHPRHEPQCENARATLAQVAQADGSSEAGQ